MTLKKFTTWHQACLTKSLFVQLLACWKAFCPWFAPCICKNKSALNHDKCLTIHKSVAREILLPGGSEGRRPTFGLLAIEEVEQVVCNIAECRWQDVQVEPATLELPYVHPSALETPLNVTIKGLCNSKPKDPDMFENVNYNNFQILQ